MEPDQVHVLAATVLRDLEEVDDTLETGLSRQLGSEVREAHGQDRIHHDLALVHAVAVAGRDVGAVPDPDAARDSAAPHALAQALGEYHD
jgi:hypothetical protein